MVIHLRYLSFCLIQIRLAKQRNQNDNHVDDDDATIINDNSDWFGEVKEWDNDLISGQNKMGKTFVSVVFL